MILFYRSFLQGDRGTLHFFGDGDQSSNEKQAHANFLKSIEPVKAMRSVIQNEAEHNVRTGRIGNFNQGFRFTVEKISSFTTSIKLTVPTEELFKVLGGFFSAGSSLIPRIEAESGLVGRAFANKRGGALANTFAKRLQTSSVIP